MGINRERENVSMTHILYNPLANGGNGCEGLDDVIAAFEGEEQNVQDITRLDTRPFLMSLPETDKVILCGGDGTINHLINDLCDELPGVPVYIWKFGTGNDFWRDVPVKQEKEMVLLNDYIRNLPVTEVNGRRIRFVNNCSYGMDGLICEIGEEQKRRTKKRVSYAKLALRVVFRDYQRANARVTVDGETREYEKVWMATVMNGRYLGGGMKLAPGQDRLSDKVCCVVWHTTPRFLSLILFVSVFWGGHVKLKNMFDMRFGRDVQVEFDRPAAMQLDGEVVHEVTQYSTHK